jgi:SAM-dependent methyltransferase
MSMIELTKTAIAENGKANGDKPDSVERFSNRVENYAKHRPGYPPEVLELFEAEMELTEDSVVADIGSGTGISSCIFLENGNRVYGVEPNSKMRETAERRLARFDKFHSVDGTAENTGLPGGSIDIVIAAQAFHWFRPEETRGEFKRILKSGGWVALMWNERQLNTTPFLEDYEQFLLKYASDYTAVRHDNINEITLLEFFGKRFERASFPNAQVLDFDGLLGRAASSSYMPSEGDERFPEMEDELRGLFAKHAESGKITVFYDTNVFYTRY